MFSWSSTTATSSNECSLWISDGRGARLQLQRRGYAIAQCQLLTEGNTGVVVVHVDEARSNHQAGGIYHLLATNGLISDRNDLAIVDGEVAHGIQSALRIDDAATGNDQG